MQIMLLERAVINLSAIAISWENNSKIKIALNVPRTTFLDPPIPLLLGDR